MRVGMIISSNDGETVFNALRLAVHARAQGDEVQVFLLGKGVELDQIENGKFDVCKLAEALLHSGGRIQACGTCLRLREKDGSQLCPVSTLHDLYEIVAESDRLVMF